jgi:hypothetical protein
MKFVIKGNGDFYVPTEQELEEINAQGRLDLPGIEPFRLLEIDTRGLSAAPAKVTGILQSQCDFEGFRAGFREIAQQIFNAGRKFERAQIDAAAGTTEPPARAVILPGTV